MFNLQKFSAITSMTFEMFSNPSEDIEEKMLYIGDGMGYIRVFSLESLIRHSEISRISSSFKEKRRMSNKIEDVIFVKYLSVYDFRLISKLEVITSTNYDIKRISPRAQEKVEMLNK